MKLNELEIKILVELKKHHPNMTLAWMLNVSRDPEFKTSLELLRSLELVEVTWYGERDPSKPRHARITAEGPTPIAWLK